MDRNLQLRMLEYRSETNRSLYGAFKKAQARTEILYALEDFVAKNRQQQELEEFRAFHAAVAANNGDVIQAFTSMTTRP